jgi:PAS domain S-box-containing protein
MAADPLQGTARGASLSVPDFATAARRRAASDPVRLRTPEESSWLAAGEFEALAGFVSGVVSLTDTGGVCRWISPSVTDARGWRPDQCVGRPDREFVHPDDLEPMDLALARLRARGQRGRLPVHRIRRADGSYVWIESEVAVVRDPHTGEPVALVSVGREVDEQVVTEERTRAAGAELRRRLEQLEQVNRELDRFAAVVAHDIAAPLLVVSNYARMLVETSQALTPEQADYLGRITRTVERMQRLIDDLRRFTLADAELELEKVDLNDMLGEVLETLGPLIGDRNPRITVDGVLPTVVGDRAQLAQLLQNLVSNAIKFGPDQDGEIRIGARRANDQWSVSVTDQGSGIAPEDRQRVFEPFRRLRGTGHLPGTGLGLTICQRVVANHRGELRLESELGSGSTFTFTLPDREPSRNGSS